MKHRGWLAICDRCGFEYKSYQLRKEWQGLMTCKSCWEPRHPQDFVRVTRDDQTPPWTRPEGEDTFIQICTIEGQSGYAGFAVAGCAIAGNNNVALSVLLSLQESRQRP